MKTFTTPLAIDAAVDMLKTGIDDAGMRLVAHINGQANAAKIGKTVPGDQILEIFRPDFAVRVWAACKPAGHDIPLRAGSDGERGRGRRVGPVGGVSGLRERRVEYGAARVGYANGVGRRRRRAPPSAGSRAWSHGAGGPTAAAGPCAGTNPRAGRGRGR